MYLYDVFQIEDKTARLLAERFIKFGIYNDAFNEIVLRPTDATYP